MPLILLEYGAGRFTKKAPVEAFAKLIGPSYRFMGAFSATIGTFIGYELIAH
jgi:SNF family Na+-dependent transporter